MTRLTTPPRHRWETDEERVQRLLGEALATLAAERARDAGFTEAEWRRLMRWAWTKAHGGVTDARVPAVTPSSL